MLTPSATTHEPQIAGAEPPCIDSPERHEALARIEYLVRRGSGCGLLLGGTRPRSSALLSNFAATLRRQGASTAVVGGSFDVRTALFDLAIQWETTPHDADDEYALWRTVADRLMEHHYLQRPSVVLVNEADRASAELTHLLLQLTGSAAAAQAPLVLILAVSTAGLSEMDPALLDLVDLRIELTT